MPTQTWVARFVVDHGQVTEEGGRLRSFPRRRLDEPEADLHVLAEPSAPNAEEFASQALEAIGRAFVRDNLSLTGGLLRSLATTHQTLADWNRRSLPKDQVSLGITAAVVIGPVVYLAQVGPSLVYIRRGGRLERMVPQGEAAVALGEKGHSPALRRLELKPGDIVVAASQSLETIIDEDDLDSMLARGADEALPQLYLTTRNEDNFALFAVTCFESELEESPPDVPDWMDDEPVRRGDDGQPALTFEPQTSAAEERPRPVLVAPRPLDISRPVVRLREDTGASRGLYPRTTARQPGIRLPASTPRLLAVLAVVALVAWVASLILPDLVQENRAERSAGLLLRAQQALAASAQETDPARQRVLLEETRRLSTEAMRINPQNLIAEEVRQQATIGLAALDAVFDLGPMQTVSVLSRELTGALRAEALVVAAGTAYLLDTGGGRVIALPVPGGGTPRVVFENGATYGGTPAKQPAQMTWDATNNRLLILDLERKLFELRPGSAPQPLALRRTTAWSSVTAIAAYDGNLYVLDPRGNQVHRYLPAASGYDSEPTIALGGQVPLSGARNLAVDADFFVTYDDGRVRRFRSGAQADLLFGGIDRPIVAPSSVSIMRAEGVLIVADTGNKRAVVADLNGPFRRQYVSSAFTDLRAIAVDAGAGQLYALVGDTLLTAPMPR
jgi:hypothetical protein